MFQYACVRTWTWQSKTKQHGWNALFVIFCHRFDIVLIEKHPLLWTPKWEKSILYLFHTRCSSGNVCGIGSDWQASDNTSSQGLALWLWLPWFCRFPNAGKLQQSIKPAVLQRAKHTVSWRSGVLWLIHCAKVFILTQWVTQEWDIIWHLEKAIFSVVQRADDDELLSYVLNHQIRPLKSCLYLLLKTLIALWYYFPL